MLKAYLALEYAWGKYGKGHGTDFLWSKIYGPTIFKDTIPRLLIMQLGNFCDSISRAHDLVALRMTGSPTSETFLTDLR